LRTFNATEADLRAINPRLVYARGAGLGDRGPRADDPCQDTVGMAYGGFMWTSANSASEPYYPPGAMADVLSGTTLAFGVLAALRERDRTGEGQYVSSSQLQSLMWMQYLNVGVAANFNESFLGTDRMSPGSAMVNMYICADGRWVALGLILDSHWAPFCHAVGLAHLLDDERFAEMWPRINNAVPLARILEGHFLQRPSSHWLEKLRAAGLWVSPVNSVADLAAGDEQVEANGYLSTFDDGRRMPSGPFSLAGHRTGTAAAPDFSANTDEILGDLGLSEAEVDALRVDGAVW
jgi:crotonobetainyl-CoA:carnitine CoA-transferase CaiB-like acyl-CoA transferase